MDKIDLANRIFNSQNHEDRSNGERPISSFKSATATSDSENGYVTVVFDERNVQTDAYGAGVKLPTIGNVTKGQQVLVASVEKNGISTLTVLGSNGSGDAVATAANNAKHMAMTAEESMSYVKQMAQSASDKAEQALTHTAVAGKTYAGTCTTSTPVAAKTLTVDPAFRLTSGTTVIVGFKYGNSAASPTLNVNNTGAKPILTNGMPYAYCANETRTLLLYDGTNWQNCSMQLYGESLLLGNPKEQNMLLTNIGMMLRTSEDPYCEITEDGLSLPTHTIQRFNDETIFYTTTKKNDIVEINYDSPGESRWSETRNDLQGSTQVSYNVPQLNTGRLRLRLPLEGYMINNTTVESLTPYLQWDQPNNDNGNRYIILTWTLTPRSNLSSLGGFSTDVINGKLDYTSQYSISVDIVGYYLKGQIKSKWFELQNTKLVSSLGWLTSMTGTPPKSSKKLEFYLKGPQTIDIDKIQSSYPSNHIVFDFLCTFKPYKLMADLNLYTSFINIVIGNVTPEQTSSLMQYSNSFTQTFCPNIVKLSSQSIGDDVNLKVLKNDNAYVVESLLANTANPQLNLEVGNVSTEQKEPNDYYEGEHGWSQADQEEHLAFRMSVVSGFAISSRIKNMSHPTNFLAPLESKVPIRSSLMGVSAHQGVSFFGRTVLRNVPPYVLLWYNKNNVTNITNGQCRYPIGAYHMIAVVCCGSNDGPTTEFGSQNIWTIVLTGIPTGTVLEMNNPFLSNNSYVPSGEVHCSACTGAGNFYSASLKYNEYQWTYNMAKVYHWDTWKSEQLQIQKIYGLL